MKKRALCFLIVMMAEAPIAQTQHGASGSLAPTPDIGGREVEAGVRAEPDYRKVQFCLTSNGVPEDKLSVELDNESYQIRPKGFFKREELEGGALVRNVLVNDIALIRKLYEKVKTSYPNCSLPEFP